jgi:hypothetical protein
VKSTRSKAWSNEATFPGRVRAKSRQGKAQYTGMCRPRLLCLGEPFHASDGDLFESINPCFKRIQVEKITVPQRKGGQNRGYGLIRLSWARGAPIDPADICIQLSGRIKVNSRRICLCETDDTSSDPSESAPGTGSHQLPATARIRPTRYSLRGLLLPFRRRIGVLPFRRRAGPRLAPW